MIFTHDLEKKYIKIVKYVLNQIFDAKKVVIYIRFTPDQIFSGMDDKLHEVQEEICGFGEDKSKIQEFIIEKNINSIYVSLNMNQILFMISKKLKEKIKFILCQDPYYDKNNKIYTQYFNLF